MSANRLPHLAQRLFNQPLALHPAKAEVVVAALADRFGVARMFNGLNQVGLKPSDLDDDDRGRDRAYDVVAGVALIPVDGTLVQKLGSLRPWSGMTGYDGIRACLLDALHDNAVKAVVLDIDSPGGEVAGCFDLADTIYAARGLKPVWAILSEEAYSAAYALASSATRVIVPRTGGTGSIGVVCLHADLSRALEKDGVTVTVVRTGEQKFEGNAYQTLSKEALGRIQSKVDASGQLFFDLVARNRGISASTVQAMQGGTFQGADGVTAGLADAVMAPDAAFRELLDQLG